MGPYIVESWDVDWDWWSEQGRFSTLDDAIKYAREMHEISGMEVRVLKLEWRP